MADWCRELIKIDDPLNKYNLEKKIITIDGLTINKVWIPLWVVACIYEARPNVTVDLIIMCIKSLNTIVLRWWSKAKNSNNYLIQIIKTVLIKNNISKDIIYNYPTDRVKLDILYKAEWLVDVIIPRWWKWLIDSVRKNSIIPVIETWAWVVHLYLDNDIKKENYNKIKNIIINSKVSRPSVCNALDTLIINKNLDINFINEILEELKNNWVNIIKSNNNYLKEQLSLDLNIKYVNDLNESINHITIYSSKHSDGILTDNINKINIFNNKIDSSVVYTNTSTRFSDGSCFWYGWEIGISTQKLHSRWPMWAESLVTFKYLINSNFKTR
jgi:glutamate-5-semialdehyde dehydrogenase